MVNRVRTRLLDIPYARRCTLHVLLAGTTLNHARTPQASSGGKGLGVTSLVQTLGLRCLHNSAALLVLGHLRKHGQDERHTEHM